MKRQPRRTRLRLECLESRWAPATIYALDANNNLLRFDSAAPAAVTTLPITGHGANQSFRGLDFRPTSSELYASAVTTGSVVNSQIFTYVIDSATGVATLVGASAALLGAGDLPSGYDFVPTADRIRLVNFNDENARLNPNNGALAADDTNLSPAVTTTLIGLAHDRNFAFAPLTTAFAIDRSDSQLARLGGFDGAPSPNGGVVTDIGPLGFTLSPLNDGGFDIEAVTGVAFAALTDLADNKTRLYTINLNTGAATAIGEIDDGSKEIRSIAVAPPTMLTLVNARTATYVETDGDKITVRVSKGELSASDFALAWGKNGKAAMLAQLKLHDDGNEFAGANITVTVAKAATGDGLAHVGYINSTGHDLGSVRIPGDLGQIDAGDGNAVLPAVRSLSVHSMGRFGAEFQGAGGSMLSSLAGGMGALNVSGDLGVQFSVATGGTGKLGSVTIGGSILGGADSNSGAIISQGDIGVVRVGRDLQGGVGAASGGILALGNLAGVTIGGSVIGGAGNAAGQINSFGDLGSVVIRGDVIAGTGNFSGRIRSASKIGNVRVGGSVVGGAGADSGRIESVSGMGSVRIGRDVAGGAGGNSGAVVSGGAMGIVSVGGSVIGGGAGNSGLIRSTGNMGPVMIGGDVVGGTADHTGNVHSESSIASVRVRGSVIGGNTASLDSGIVFAFGPGVNHIGSVFVGGNLVGSAGSFNGSIFASDNIGSVAVMGSLRGGAGSTSAAIQANGTLGPVFVVGDVMGGAGNASGAILSNLRLASVRIDGSLIGGRGDRSGRVASTAGDIGVVAIGRDFAGGSIEGTTPTLDGAGSIESSTGRIASVSIGGSIIAGIDDSSAGSLERNATIRAGRDIGSLTVRGNVGGNFSEQGDTPVVISARGREFPAPGLDLAIGRIRIGGRVEVAQFLAGYDVALTAKNADAQIGSVLVGGDWLASDLVAGVMAGGNGFGNSGDAKISGAGTNDSAAIVSKIFSIVIVGNAYGTPAPLGSAEHFGFVAQQVVSLRVNGKRFVLTAGAANDLAGQAVGLTGDLRVLEVAL